MRKAKRKTTILDIKRDNQGSSTYVLIIGLLGNITQLPFNTWRGIVSLVPYFLQKKSPQDIDNQLISTYPKQKKVREKGDTNSSNQKFDSRRFNNIAQQIQPEEDYSQNMTYLLLLASFPSAGNFFFTIYFLVDLLILNYLFLLFFSHQL